MVPGMSDPVCVFLGLCVFGCVSVFVGGLGVGDGFMGRSALSLSPFPLSLSLSHTHNKKQKDTTSPPP